MPVPFLLTHRILCWGFCVGVLLSSENSAFRVMAWRIVSSGGGCVGVEGGARDGRGTMVVGMLMVVRCGG